MRDGLALVEVGRLRARALLHHPGQLRVETEVPPWGARLEGAVRLEEGLLGKELRPGEGLLERGAQLAVPGVELRQQVAAVLLDDLVDDGDGVQRHGQSREKARFHRTLRDVHNSAGRSGRLLARAPPAGLSGGPRPGLGASPSPATERELVLRVVVALPWWLAGVRPILIARSSALAMKASEPFRARPGLVAGLEAPLANRNGRGGQLPAALLALRTGVRMAIVTIEVATEGEVTSHPNALLPFWAPRGRA